MDTGSLEYNVIVVKWGDKFTAEHVNRIYRMAKRNLTLPFNFYCYTEDPTNIYDEVNIIPLDESLDLEKWWWKLTLFKKNNLSGINLYLDLDVVIQNNIDHLFSQAVKDKIRIISTCRDWSEAKGAIPNWDPVTSPVYNSSIMIWNNNENADIYEKFIKNPSLYQKVYHGIDRFFTYEIDQSRFTEISENDYYHRIALRDRTTLNDHISESLKIPKFDERGKRIGSTSMRVFFDPDKPICVFNSCHEEHFYQGMENFLL